MSMQLWTTVESINTPSHQQRSNLDIQRRIAEITDSRHTPTHLLTPNDISRESRMMFAAWILVCKFECILYGGFVRDWIVGSYTARPGDMLPKKWIKYVRPRPRLREAVVPADLDCKLPTNTLYDIQEIINEFQAFRMRARLYDTHWSYLLLVDEKMPTGPFTIDLIKPNIKSIPYNSIDFDVNNLFVQKDCIACLGMLYDITEPPYSITLEEIVTNIKRRSFHLLSAVNNTATGKVIGARLKKMQRRGWQYID